MEYECKQCGAGFTKAWGPAKCPKCGSKDLWITGGEITQILRGLAVILIVLAVLFMVSYVGFFGFLIGVLIGFPYVVWWMLKRRKKRN